MVKRIVWVTLALLVAMLLFTGKLAALPLLLPVYLPTLAVLWLLAYGLKKHGAVPSYGQPLLLLVGGACFFTALLAWLTEATFGEKLREIMLNRQPGGLGALDPLILACLLDAWLRYRSQPDKA